MLQKSRPSIVVLDDSIEVLNIISNILAEEGYRVRPSTSAQLALNSIAEEPPDLILTDLRMPGIDGLTFIRLLKNKKENEQIPVIVVSATDDKKTCVEALQSGASDFINKPFDNYELKTRIKNLITLYHAQQVLKARSDFLEEQVRERTLELEELAKKDYLTNLFNRLELHTQLGEAIGKATLIDSQFFVLFIDLDEFKYVNDTFGHSFGDEILKCAAKRLSEHMRDEDIIARLGGDEFVIVLNDDLESEAIKQASKFLDAIKEPFCIDNRTIYITASVGICNYPSDGFTSEELIRNADSAMYQAKKNGRNTHEFYTRKLTLDAKKRIDLETSLRMAIENEELSLYYQPKVNMRTGKIIGSEALLRWHSPKYGMVPPGQFIPLAEETGLILPIGESIIKSACLDTIEMLAIEPSLEHVSVNVSGIQFSRTDILSQVNQSLVESGLNGRYLELEITESILMSNPVEINQMLHDIRELDVSVVVDDFGTGYSSLSSLKTLEINGLKIDQSFVGDIDNDSDNDGTAIVNTIIELAKRLELDVIAEGVETQEQIEYLVDHGCDHGQGFFYSKPVPLEEFKDLLGR
ncbi:MAG: EAL domain-containing protein [Sedimenticola sp.]